MENTIIISVILVYVVFLIIVSKWMSSKAKDAEDYTLAGRTLPWFIIAASFMATIANSAQVMGAAAANYAIGFAQLFWTNVIATVVLLLLMPRVGERLRDVECSTFVDLADKRFPNSRRLHFLLIIWSIIWAIFVAAICIFGGALLIENLSGMPWKTAVFLMTLIAVVFTVLGGLKTIAVLDTIQWIIIGIASSIMLPLLYIKHGSFSSFFSKYLGATGYIETGLPEAAPIMPGFLDVFRLPGWGFWSFLAFVLACSLWVPVDLGMIQRFLSARGRGEGMKGTWAYAIIFLPTVLVLMSLGLWGRALFPNLEYPDSVVMHVARDALPLFGTALFMTAIVAAILSTVDAYFNAGSTILTNNIYKYFKPNESDSHYIKISRITTVIMAILTILAAPIIGLEGITITCVAIQMVLCAALTPVVVLSIFWKRFTEKAAFWGCLITTLVCSYSIYVAGGASNAIAGGGLFGIPTLFLGFIVGLPIFIIVSLLEPYDPEKIGPEFRDIFENKAFQYPNADLKVLIPIIAGLAIFAYLGFSKIIPAWPSLSGFGATITDIFWLFLSAVSFLGTIYIAVKLYKWLFIEKGYVTNESNESNKKDSLTI